MKRTSLDFRILYERANRECHANAKRLIKRNETRGTPALLAALILNAVNAKYEPH